MEPRAFGERFMGEALLLPEAEKNVGKGFGRVQVMSLKKLT